MSKKLCITAAALLALGASWAGAPAMAQGPLDGIRISQPIALQCGVGTYLYVVNHGRHVPKGTVITLTYQVLAKAAPPTRGGDFGLPQAPAKKLVTVTGTYRLKHTLVNADEEGTDLMGVHCLSAVWYAPYTPAAQP